MTFNLDEYVDVAERLQQFYDKYPDGRITRLGEPSVMEVGGSLFVVYTAQAYRTADDPVPAIGTAWEPFPGKTQFTRDSELMNAETASWGRAIVAAGIPSKKIASANEVANRQGTPDVGLRRSPAARDKPTDKQLTYLRKLVTENNPGDQVLRVMLDSVGARDVSLDGKWTTELNKGQVSGLIEVLKTGVLPTGESDVTPSDVPWAEDYAPEAA